MSQALYISHLVIVDNILIFYDGTHRDVDKLSQGITLLKRAYVMIISEDKFTISWDNLDNQELRFLSNRFNFQIKNMDDDLNYLGFYLKPKYYRKND